MKIGNHDGRLVLATGDQCLDVEQASGGTFSSCAAAVYDHWDDFRAAAGDLATTGRWETLTPDLLGPPSPWPRQVFAIGVNYADHAAESNHPPPAHPVVFTKFASSLTGPTGQIGLPSESVDFEAELVVVIGRRAGHVAPETAWSHVAGLTIGQDLSEREVQMRGAVPQWSLAKSHAGFSPTGPLLVTPDELADPNDLRITTTIDGETMQDDRTSNMVFDVPALIAHLSSVCTLLPGDLVFTGTPAGVGMARTPQRWLRAGETLTTSIEGLGRMRHTLVDARPGMQVPA